MSFNVASLFTSIPANLVRETIEQRLSEEVQCEQGLTTLDLIRLLNFYMKIISPSIAWHTARSKAPRWEHQYPE